MTESLRVKDWEKFQHYKDRSPPWIKFPTTTFQDYEFCKLQDASKLLLFCIWSIASKTKDGSFPADIEYIKNQGTLRTIKIENLKELIDHGFIIDASNLLADCKQSARPEERRGETETETEETNGDFENFWKLWIPFHTPKGNKHPARLSYAKALKSGAATADMLAAALAYTRDCTTRQCYTQNVATWLNQRGWETPVEKKKMNRYEARGIVQPPGAEDG